MGSISLCKGIWFCQSPKEKNVEKVGTVSEEGTLIKFTVDKASKITMMMLKSSKMRKTFKMKS